MLSGVVDERFQIEENLARTDHGEVYRAVDLTTNETVALRVLRPTSAESNELLQRQLQEFRVLRNLNHPNVLRVIHTGLTADAGVYVAMEYLHGKTLQEIIDEQGPIAPEWVAYYLDQLANLLDAAHGHNIIHRDIKPAHITIEVDDAGNHTVKLGGFFFAKVQNPGSDMAATQAGVAIGTPAYMSPEQVTGKKITKLSDIYSLGVILYTALTGVPPYEHKTDFHLMLAHVKNPFPPFILRNPKLHLPEGIEAVVRYAMTKDPIQRPKSASELAALFREAVENTEQIPAAVPERVVEELRAAAVVAAAAPPPKKSSRVAMLTMLAVSAAVLIGLVLGMLLRR